MEDIAYAIWSSGNGTVKTRYNGVLQDGATLAGALTGANGLCAGTPCLIARLLFPEDALVGLDLLALEDLRRGDDDRVGGLVCFRVEGVRDTSQVKWPGLEGFPKEFRVSILIDKATYLIRRVQSDAKSDSVHMVSTFEFVPQVNKGIADGELRVK
ncbi:MAG: hypothetical protein AAF581_18275 [Planctomycetota bacterium]